jgi:hypothetical protein
MIDRLVPRQPLTSGVPSRIAERLRELAEQVRRLDPPSHREPQQFHIAKSDLMHELRRVARDAESALID